ncbi:MAG: glycosyltransferase family 39 protein [Negativicutes bacterium]|nr:glycosyltransferase family 39 protein [Negativicutes bacterium]
MNCFNAHSEGRFSPRFRRSFTDILACVISLFPNAIYQFIYFKSYFPITEGWFSAYASLISSGSIPYKDFYLLLPPLYPFHIAALQALFGDSIFVLRVFGFLITLLIGILLFCILRQFFNRWIAAFTAAVGLIYYQAGNAYIGYDFTQLLTLYALIALYCMLRYIENVGVTDDTRHTSKARSFLFLSGFFLANAALIKQSNGGFVSLGVSLWLLLFLARSQSLRRATGDLLHFGFGALVPPAAIAIWLAMNSAIAPFLNQVIFDALAAKGGEHAILTGWVYRLFGPSGFDGVSYKLAIHCTVLFGTVAITSMAIIALSNVFVDRRRSAKDHIVGGANILGVSESWRNKSALVVCLTGLLLLCVIIIYVYLYSPLWSSGWNVFYINIVVIMYDDVKQLSLYCYIVMFLIYSIIFVFRPHICNSKWMLLFSFCLILTAGNGTSAGLSEISAFLGFSVIAGYLISLSAPALLPSLIPIGLCLLWSAFLIEQKFESPYAWWSVTSGDVRKTQCAATSGILKYVCVDPDNYSNIQRLVNAVDQNSTKSDPILVFPHEPILYLLSDRPPFAKAVVTWFDFISADQGEVLIKNLNDHPPRVMVISRLPASVFDAHEHLFNGGKLGVQRQIMTTIDAQSRSGQIKLVEAREIDGILMEVYVRTDTDIE